MPLRARCRRLGELLRPRDGALYALWAAVCTLACARSFYSYMLKQTGGEWSAPLDDVFIHFDFARSAARGHPFEWTIGNGYSSGNTSLLYPLVLAVGYLVGFVGPRLMVWAAVVAAVSVFGALLVARRLLVFPDRRADAWTRASSYLLPPVLLGLGTLDWSLWSGMEIALLLAVWACAMKAYLELVRAAPESRSRAAWVLGGWGAALVLTRPEAATTVAVLAIAGALVHRATLGLRRAALLVGRVAAPGAAVVAAQALVNRLLTGDFAPSGAVVKLTLYAPFLTIQEKVDDFAFNLNYEVWRNLGYHFTDIPAFGVLVPALALGALCVPRTRHLALLIWAQIAGWLLVVAFNGQVRWQNERYTMPAVAWLLILAVLGASALLRKSTKPTMVATILCGTVAAQLLGVLMRPPDTAPDLQVAWPLALLAGAGAALALTLWPVRIAFVAASLFLAHEHQASNLRGQRWFFGRACRNIRDQHVTAGRLLAGQLPDGHEPHRVLVGDAGALIYASDRPGLDLIGLGGFHGLPFARAGGNGLAASLELLEHVPPAELPDVMVIYPSWWGVLPLWFTRDIVARVPAEGNVICGGYEDVVYETDWSLLGTGNAIRTPPPGERPRDSLDLADVLSEGAHDYRFSIPDTGTSNKTPDELTDMKALADPADGAGLLWDGGRRVRVQRSESFTMRGLEAGRDAHLVVRSAPAQPAAVRVVVSGVEVDTLVFEPTDGWVERAARLPAQIVKQELRIELFDDGPGEFVDYHAWLTQ